MNIGPVVSAENRLTNGNCVACSRGSAYFVEYLRIYWTDFHNFFQHMKAHYVQMMDRYLFSDFSRDVAMATKSFVNVRYNTAKKTGIFCQIFPDILDIFSQSFHQISNSCVNIS